MRGDSCDKELCTNGSGFMKHIVANSFPRGNSATFVTKLLKLLVTSDGIKGFHAHPRGFKTFLFLLYFPSKVRPSIVRALKCGCSPYANSSLSSDRSQQRE